MPAKWCQFLLAKNNRKMCTHTHILRKIEKAKKRKIFNCEKKVDTWTVEPLDKSHGVATFSFSSCPEKRHKQSHCAHSNQMMCEISIVKLTIEIDRSVSVTSHTVIKLEVYWFVLTHSHRKNFPNWKFGIESFQFDVWPVLFFLIINGCGTVRFVFLYPLLISRCSIKIICNYIWSKYTIFIYEYFSESHKVYNFMSPVNILIAQR